MKNALKVALFALLAVILTLADAEGGIYVSGIDAPTLARVRSVPQTGFLAEASNSSTSSQEFGLGPPSTNNLSVDNGGWPWGAPRGFVLDFSTPRLGIKLTIGGIATSYFSPSTVYEDVCLVLTSSNSLGGVKLGNVVYTNAEGLSVELGTYQAGGYFLGSPICGGFIAESTSRPWTITGVLSFFAPTDSSDPSTGNLKLECFGLLPGDGKAINNGIGLLNPAVVDPVPEPSTIALAIFGVGVAVLRRKFKKS